MGVSENRDPNVDSRILIIMGPRNKVPLTSPVTRVTGLQALHSRSGAERGSSRRCSLGKGTATTMATPLNPLSHAFGTSPKP